MYHSPSHPILNLNLWLSYFSFHRCPLRYFHTNIYLAKQQKTDCIQFSFILHFLDRHRYTDICISFLFSQVIFRQFMCFSFSFFFNPFFSLDLYKLYICINCFKNKSLFASLGSLCSVKTSEHKPLLPVLEVHESLIFTFSPEILNLWRSVLYMVWVFQYHSSNSGTGKIRMIDYK